MRRGRAPTAGSTYSLIVMVFGSSSPTRPASLAVYQTLPILSSTSPCGPESRVGSGYSLNTPVTGSSRPITLARWPVYQTDPSAGEYAGSCGYGGLLGVIH